MKRCSFNGGELSSSTALRSDLDIYHRGASKIENFDISASGGLTRRRGMRHFANAQASSRLIPYIYSNDERYLIEIGTEHIRIYSPNATLEKALPSPYNTAETIAKLRGKQLNNLLILTVPSIKPMVLKRDASTNWILEPYKFDPAPKRHYEQQDSPITITALPNSQNYQITGDTTLDGNHTGDILNATILSETQLANSITSLPPNLLLPANFTKTMPRGTVAAIYEPSTNDYWIVKKQFSASNIQNGFYQPGNYPDYFSRVSSPGDRTPFFCTSLQNLVPTLYVGGIVAIMHQDLSLYTAITDVEFPSKITPDNIRNSPLLFKKGIICGKVLSCKGKWKFICSGTWSGEYEIRRSYTRDKYVNANQAEDKEKPYDWVTIGTSLSEISSPSNMQLAGDESQDACFLMLALTKIENLNPPQSGLPPASCDNRLSIDPAPYNLEFIGTGNPDEYSLVSKVPYKPTLATMTHDWSWQAFGESYGYPAICDIYQSRLVFTATTAQPQTLWLSKTDDLKNFETVKTDDSALALTMSTTTQNPICWIMAQNNRLMIGTTDAEWTLTGGDNTLTHANAHLQNHGYVGSSNSPALMATDKTLYCERGGGRIYQYGYSYESDGYTSQDLTIFADHILSQGGGAIDGCFLRKPDPKALILLANGTLALMTYNTLQEVNAWHRYSTNGYISSIATLPNGNQADSIYLTTKRGNNHYIETIDQHSNYQDNLDATHSQDYPSTLLTNALCSLETTGSNKHNAPIGIYITSHTNAEHINISNDGTTWSPLDRAPSQALPQGWNQLTTNGQWQYDAPLGIRITGNTPFQLLAIQT